MGASKNEFNKLRSRWVIDEREVNEYPPFDHDKRFCEKVKLNWLTSDDFTRLKSADLIELTQALIDKKIDSDYLDELIKLIDKAEPKYISEQKYIELVAKTPIENMKRIFKKYDNIDYFIKTQLRKGLELLILNKEDENK